MRLYTGLSAPEGSFAEVLDTIGPLANDQEISTRFITDLATDLTFFTDNNGLELQERVTYVRDHARDGRASGDRGRAGWFEREVGRLEGRRGWKGWRGWRAGGAGREM